MLNRSRQLHLDSGDRREGITSARQAAEALFKPKRQPTEPSDREPAPAVGESVRKPRVLPVSPPAPARPAAAETPKGPQQRPEQPQLAEIPRSQFARIRTWAKYGMTARQVAEVYRVPVHLIERILRKA